jgi:hypothetical protein
MEVWTRCRHRPDNTGGIFDYWRSKQNRIEETDEITINFGDCVIRDITKNEEYEFKSLPEFMQKLFVVSTDMLQ